MVKSCPYKRYADVLQIPGDFQDRITLLAGIHRISVRYEARIAPSGVLGNGKSRVPCPVGRRSHLLAALPHQTRCITLVKPYLDHRPVAAPGLAAHTARHRRTD